MKDLIRQNFQNTLYYSKLCISIFYNYIKIYEFVSSFGLQTT